MIRMALVLLGLGAMGGCGADGAPFVPQASVGVGFGTGGVTTSTSVGASNGNLSLGASLYN